MPLFERYVLRRIITASIAPLLVFTCMIWIIQFLRELDLVTTSGQSITVFLLITVLAMPTVLQVLVPFALLTGMIAALNGLNNDNELAAITAAGAPRRTVMRPVLLSGMIAAALLVGLYTYLAPLSTNGLREIMTWVRADLLANVVRDGGFRSLDRRKLTIHIRSRNPDGSFNDIFVNDERNPKETVQYVALHGAMIRDVRGAFLILDRGKLIRDRRNGSSYSVTNFDTYAVDLSQFSKVNYVRQFHPRELSTMAIWQMDDDDEYFQENRLRVMVEWHDRWSSPLYPLAFAIIVYALMGQARTTRANQLLSVYATIAACVVIRAAGFYFYAAAHAESFFALLLYVPPLLGIAGGIFLIVTDMRLRLPSWLTRWNAALAAGWKRRRAAAGAPAS